MIEVLDDQIAPARPSSRRRPTSADRRAVTEASAAVAEPSSTLPCRVHAPAGGDHRARTTAAEYPRTLSVFRPVSNSITLTVTVHLLWVAVREHQDEESTDGGDSKEKWYPLLDVRERPVARRVLTLAKRRPLSRPPRRRWQPPLERSDHRPLAGVELPVGPDDPEPDQALEHQHRERENAQPWRRLRRVLPEDTDCRKDHRVQREEERVRQRPACADPVGHLHVQLVLSHHEADVGTRSGGVLVPQGVAEVGGIRCRGLYEIALHVPDRSHEQRHAHPLVNGTPRDLLICNRLVRGTVACLFD